MLSLPLTFVLLLLVRVAGEYRQRARTCKYHGKWEDRAGVWGVWRGSPSQMVCLACLCLAFVPQLQMTAKMAKLTDGSVEMESIGTVSWAIVLSPRLKNGAEVPTGARSRYRIKCEGTRHLLIIDDVMREDSGTYSLMATGGTSQAKVKVDCMYHCLPNYLSIPLSFLLLSYNFILFKNHLKVPPILSELLFLSATPPPPCCLLPSPCLPSSETPEDHTGPEWHNDSPRPATEIALWNLPGKCARPLVPQWAGNPGHWTHKHLAKSQVRPIIFVAEKQLPFG